MPKSVPPSVNEVAFDCPHCGAYTTQFWRKLFSQPLDRKNPTPVIPDDELEEMILNDSELQEPARKNFAEFCERMRTKKVFEGSSHNSVYNLIELNDVWVSKCYACDDFTVWVHDAIVWPPTRTGDAPNPDLPEDITKDYEEARSILELSPRGAAALLRLCIQKLCKELGEPGKNIDTDIASLVAKGLNPLVQKSLDSVRVIGNESVHPGELDLRDNPDIAKKLFKLVNAITDQMISHPKTVEEIYGKIPEGKREAIEQRNEKAKKSFLDRFKKDD